MQKRTIGRYRGDFVAWAGGCAFMGTGGNGAISSHSHYAIQLVLGAPSGLRVQLGRRGDWIACAAALVPSRAIHSIDVSGCDTSTVIFVEPETAEGRAIAARLQGKPEVLQTEQVAIFQERIAHAWGTQKSYDAVSGVCQQLVEDIARTALPQPSDARVLAAIEYIREQLDQTIKLADVAQVAALSPGRFRHLFVEQTGMPLRTYVLWRRLLHVWTLLMQGTTLSAAAHAAGFADSAHLSRTSRTMFGLAPSLLQMSGPLSEHARAQKAAVISAG
ncbi:MAG: AraC family transcriptional regulator [Pseudomonadota bacterium]